jgi:hypothetical protein
MVGSLADDLRGLMDGCSNHGGRSTGPRTVNGKERQKNAVLRHGYWTQESISNRRFINNMIRDAKNICCGFNEQ